MQRAYHVAGQAWRSRRANTAAVDDDRQARVGSAGTGASHFYKLPGFVRVAGLRR